MVAVGARGGKKSATGARTSGRTSAPSTTAGLINSRAGMLANRVVSGLNSMLVVVVDGWMERERSQGRKRTAGRAEQEGTLCLDPCRGCHIPDAAERAGKDRAAVNFMLCSKRPASEARTA